MSLWQPSSTNRLSPGPDSVPPMPPRHIPLLYVQRGVVVTDDGKGFWVPIGDTAASVKAVKAKFDAAESVYLVDLDGQFNGAANIQFFQELERRRVFPWIDAGCRRPEDVMDVLFSGAESITAQLKHLNPEQLEEVGGMTEADFHLGLTFDHRGMDSGLRPADVVAMAEKVAATGIVLYEGERADWSKVDAACKEFHDAGLPSAWVAKPESQSSRYAQNSQHVSVLIDGPGAK